MSTRFHKRVNVLPGLSINVGKKGASVSIGAPGLRKTYKKNGVRTTVGIPGSGLSHTSYHRYESSQQRNQSRHMSTATQRQVQIRTQKQNGVWGWVLFMLAVGSVIASFTIPNLIGIGRWVIAILCGGFFLLGSIIFFTATSKEDIERKADYMCELNKVGEQLEKTEQLFEQRKREYKLNKIKAE